VTIETVRKIYYFSNQREILRLQTEDQRKSALKLTGALGHSVSSSIATNGQTSHETSELTLRPLVLVLALRYIATMFQGACGDEKIVLVFSLSFGQPRLSTQSSACSLDSQHNH
jgi:hypothetical protein